jgi:ribosomal protein S18 acetylase RimI-like enzyme
MAVDEMYRRRGMAQRMLEAGESVVRKFDDGKRSAMVLSVAKYNTEAISLYEKCGFIEDENWEDPRWLESVSRGRVDVERRILMVKRL